MPNPSQLDLLGDWGTAIEKLEKNDKFATSAMRSLQDLIIEHYFDKDQKKFIDFVHHARKMNQVIIPDEFHRMFSSVVTHKYLRIIIAALNGDNIEAEYWKHLLKDFPPPDFTLSPGMYERNVFDFLHEGQTYMVLGRIKAMCNGIIDASRPPERFKEELRQIYGGELPREKIMICRFQVMSPLIKLSGPTSLTYLYFSKFASGACLDPIS